MTSVFVRATVITGILFVPMIVINVMLAGDPKFEEMNWGMFALLTGILLVFIVFFVSMIKTKVGKKGN